MYREDHISKWENTLSSCGRHIDENFNFQIPMSVVIVVRLLTLTLWNAGRLLVYSGRPLMSSGTQLFLIILFRKGLGSFQGPY